MKTVRVGVTPEDITDGHSSMAYHCAVSLAISRAIGCRVRVDETYWQIDKDGPTGVMEMYAKAKHKLPDDVTRFIRVFDAQGVDHVKPFEFDLDVPDAV